jgi:glutaredoxin
MNDVRLYGFAECPFCQELKEMFERDNIPYKYIDIELEENKEETSKVMEIAKCESVPLILVKKTILAPEISFKTIKEANELTKKLLSE